MAPQPVTDEPQRLYLTPTGRRSGRHYLVAEHGEAARWVRNLRAEAAVSVRVDDETFRGRARFGWNCP